MRGRGASLVFDSQKGKMTRHKIPITSIAMMLPLFHPSEAFPAIVSGIRINANPALSNKISPISISDHSFFNN
jgi:hypothetical protein